MLLASLLSISILIAGCNLFADERTSSKENNIQKEVVEELPMTSIEWTNGLPDPQQKGGVYLFTKQNHPIEIAYSFQWNQYDVLLVQSNADQVRGHELDVLAVEKVSPGVDVVEADRLKPNLIRIVVRLTPGKDAGNPNAMPASRYVELKRGLIDMKTTRFEIVNEKGEKVPLN